MDNASVWWTITLPLFIGALGLPVPENPLLVAGGYAIFKKACSPWIGIFSWHAAIYLGDIILYALSYWVFTRPRVARYIYRRMGMARMKRIKRAFTRKAPQTLFLARMAFGLRASAYIVAGAAQYPWKQFLIIDGLSVAVQTLIFVGIGFFSGERIEWALQAADRIALALALFAAVGLIISWMTTAVLNRNAGFK